jgi:Concanavalin A-like lectin/glucanases superfamily
MDEEEFIPEVYDYSWNIRDAVGSVDFAGLGGWIPTFTGSRGGRLFNSTVDTYVLCPDPYPGVHDVSFTICMIATRVGAPDPGQERSLLGRGYNASGTDWSVECTHDSNNAVIFRLVTTTGGVVERTCQTADGVMTTGAQMFHFVWEAGVGARIYRNSVLAASISFTEGNLRASANQNWILGKSRRIDTANGYYGAMSDVALFSSPLSPAVITGQWDGRNTLEVFTPRSLPGIRGWFDFSDDTSITEISGKVAQIDHQSPGSSLFASDALDANRPLYVVEPGSGLNVGRGTGTQNLSFSQPFVPISNTIPSGRGYCCVIGGNEDPTFGTIFLSSTDTQNYYLDLEPGGFLYVSVSNTLRTLSGLANTSDGSLHMMLHSVTPAGWELRYDAQTSSGVATTWTQINAIGNYQSAPFRLQGSVGEIIIGVAPLTQFMKDALQAWSQTKWGTP